MKYIAHRGLSSQAPENTIAAFQLAANTPEFFGIECDIHQTKDNQFVVFHDDDLKRMAKVTHKIKDLTYEELLKYPIKTGSKIKSHPNQTIPLLTDFLTICEEYQKTAVIEIKQVHEMENLSDLLLILEHFPTVNVIFISFNLSYLKYMRAISDISLKLLCDKVTDALIYDLRVNNINFSIQKDSFKPALINKLKKKGFEIATFTVNKKTTAKQLEKMGIDYITTDKIL
ncbi:MAG: glycerophosphodiester phosphodiesterase family protein [Acholeplasmataceae bacterium]|jgi:glycerophosphoryl diester phosphodiesterase|nr:glycerophosphodiester phosphodiesterase family protein [Acholeplasmataceae bacterium]